MSAEVSHDWNGQDVTVSAGDIEHIHIQYPNYERHDCEARTICFHIHIIWEGGRKNNRAVNEIIGPCACCKCLLALSHLRIYDTVQHKH